MAFKYAIDDELTKKDYSDTATPDVTFAYDTYFPRVTSRQDGAGTTTFTYQSYNSAINGGGQVALVDGPLADDTQKFTYDELGRLKKLEIVDDSTHTTASWSEEYTFGSRSRVTTVANSLGSATYAFVGESNRASKVTSTDGGFPFRFEAPVTLDAGANTVVVEAKDGNNNTSIKTYVVTTTGTSTTYQYDVKGNLCYDKQPNGTVLREYQWDQQNRLVKALIGTRESDYEYDGASRRWRITEKESGTRTNQETFVWCGGSICQKRSGSTVERSYFGNGFQETTTNSFYTRDHLGSVREVVGSDGTTVASRLSYDPWGKVTETGSGALSDFTYAGHYFDRATGLNLAQYRGYDAGLGRWLSSDPAGLGGGG